MTARFSPVSIVFGLLLPVLFLGCGSAQKKRLDLRDKLATSSGMYCEFVSGDMHDDIDVELNLQMARRCDGSKPLTITNYKNSSENIGIIYCCSMKRATPAPAPLPAPKESKENEDLDLSDEPAKPVSEKKNDKPALPPKTNPSTLNNPAAPAKAAAPPASAPAPSNSATAKPAAAATSSTTSAAQTTAKPSTPAAQQNPTPKSPNKTSDIPDADILGE